MNQASKHREGVGNYLTPPTTHTLPTPPAPPAPCFYRSLRPTLQGVQVIPALTPCTVKSPIYRAISAFSSHGAGGAGGFLYFGKWGLQFS